MERLFLAVRPLPAIMADLIGLQQECKLFPPSLCRWTPGPSLHLTLHFLGSQDYRTRESLRATLKKVQALPPCFQKLDGWVAFPNTKRATVAGVGSQNVNPTLAVLHEFLKTCLLDEKLPVEERPFYPHISIVRFRSNFPLKVLPRLETPMLLEISKVSLYRSHLESAGARHEVLEEFPLAGHR
jgi:RNA 2',3'-cyclic 3'-phosphodiesterase